MKVLRDMLTIHVRKLGFRSVAAESGAIALTKLHQEAIDLVLLDLMMPDMSGFEVITRMKEDELLHHIPIIVISAMDDLNTVARCLELGADDHLPKPYNRTLLQARLAGSLRKKEIRDKEVALMAQIRKEKKRADDLLDVVIPLGVALSAEKNYDRLLERILLEAKALSLASAGTLYLRTGVDQLSFVALWNDDEGIAFGGTTGTTVPFPPTPLRLENGEPNLTNVAAYVTWKGETLNLRTVAEVRKHGFKLPELSRGLQAKEAEPQASFLVIPLKDSQEEILGVLQLLDARDRDTGHIVPFDDHIQQLVESLSTLAAVALESYRREQELRQELSDLRIEIDEMKRKKEVSNIRQSTYFQELQSQAQEMRQKRKKRPD